MYLAGYGGTCPTKSMPFNPATRQLVRAATLINHSKERSRERQEPVGRHASDDAATNFFAACRGLSCHECQKAKARRLDGVPVTSGTCEACACYAAWAISASFLRAKQNPSDWPRGSVAWFG